MVKAATVAPVKASISTPVLAVKVVVQLMTTSRFSLKVIVILQSSKPNGCHKGINSPVFLAAITPAIMAI